MRRIFIYLLLSLILVSCKKENTWDCFKSNGPETSETRRPGEFNTIQVFDKIDISLVQGSEYKLELMAGRHLLKNIFTGVKDGALIIKNNNTCNFVRGYKRGITVRITVPTIWKVENRGVGTVRFDNAFDQDSLKVMTENSGDIYVTGTYRTLATSSNGNGDIYLSGRCDRLYAYLYGTNFLHGENLSVTSYISLETVSIGDCYLNVGSAASLNVEIWRSGNVYYQGSPAAENSDYRENCKGRVIKKS